MDDHGSTKQELQPGLCCSLSQADHTHGGKPLGNHMHVVIYGCIGFQVGPVRWRHVSWQIMNHLACLDDFDGLSGSNSQLFLKHSWSLAFKSSGRDKVSTWFMMSRIPLLVQVVTAWILAHHVEARHWTTGLPALFCCKAARWVSSSLKSGIAHKWLMAKTKMGTTYKVEWTWCQYDFFDIS